MYNQYQSYHQQNQPTTTAYSSSQPTNSNVNGTVLSAKPVEYYTSSYHGWQLQATEWEQQYRMLPASNAQGKQEIQKRIDWAKYYADLSSKAAHYFYQNPNATSAPFDLPPEPPKKISASSFVSSSNKNSQRSTPRRDTHSNNQKTAGSLESYVRACINQCKNAEQSKIVQSKVEIRIAEAIQKGDMHSRDWSLESLIPVPGSASSPSSSSSSRKQKKPEIDCASNNGYYGSANGDGTTSASGYYGPSSSISSPNPSLPSYSYKRNDASETYISSTQKRKSEGNIGIAKLNKKHKGGKQVRGFEASKRILAKRASRFSGAGGLQDASKTNSKCIRDHDKYMGKGMIGGSNVALDENDFERMTVKGTCTTLEKEYLRLTAPPRPELVRPENILKKHLKKLKRYYAKRDRKEYLWFCSQLKAIRQDCTVQRIQNEFAVDVYETHARIALQEGDLNEYNQCQTQLQDLYRDNASVPNHEEFIAYKLLYYVFLSCNDQYDGGSSDMLKIMLSLNAEKRNHPAIEHALKIRECMAHGNYLLFFRLHKSAPNLGDQLTSRIVPTMRLRGLRRMAKAYRPTLDVQVCSERLGFDSLEEGRDWLVRCGCVLDGTKILMKDSIIREPGEEKKNSLI